MTTVKYDDLLMALEFVSAGYLTENSAYISVETGKIHWDSEGGYVDEELPEDIDEPDRYVSVPHKTDLDLGRKVALDFAARELGDEYEKVFNIFRKKGAYARFKDLLESRDMLEKWFQFEEQAVRTALQNWAEAQGIRLSYEPPGDMTAPDA